MPSQRTDASVAFSVTDNLSQSIVGMKNSFTSFKQDVTGLQQQLDKLDSTRFQLKNFDLKNARQELERTKRALQELGDTATESDREAARADFERANQNYENVRRQLNLVSKQARQTERDLLDATDAISKADNRAGSLSSGVLSALGKAGLLDMAGDVALDFSNLVVGSAFGSNVGGVVSSGISGALSGAAMGSLLGPVGTAIGASIGGGLGLLQGGTQVAQEQDEAFKQYYSDQYDQVSAATDESLSAGGDTAAQRELDAIAFNRLLGEGVGDQFLTDLRQTAADTPMEYADLTSISRSLATGFGDSPERMLELITAIGDAGSAVGVTADDMNYMAQAMSRMQSSGKATLEYLQIFQDRGVDVIGMLSDAMGKTQGEIYDMISDGDINGQDAVDIIQQGMQSMFGGAMETMSQTFDGLTSTLEDAMTEIDNAMGEGYNEKAKEGLQADIDAYGGALGDAMAQANSIIGEGRAIAENLSRQYDREAMQALTMGTSTTVYSDEQAAKLQDMHEQYTSLVDQYQTATEEDKAVIAAQIEALMEDAEAMAESNYNASEMAQDLRETGLDQISAIRENTAALGNVAWMGDYNTQQEQSKGQAAALSGFNLLNQEDAKRFNEGAFATQDAIWKELNGHASGLTRVPYDNYLAYLHEGERVLTASQTREMDQRDAAGISITVTGNTFGAGMDEAAVAEAIADTVVRKLLAGYRG